MKVLFMGTPEFALYSLKTLYEMYDVVAVVTQPDKPNKRGNRVEISPVKEFAIEKNIDVLQPESAKNVEFIEKLKKYEPDFIIVAAYGQILPKKLLDIPKKGCLNVHASLLPKYRGAAPIQWAIMNGDKQTGITIMSINERLDAGDMILKYPVIIETDDDYGKLYEKLAKQGAVSVIEALNMINEGAASRIMQNDAEAIYAPMIMKETGRIKWGDEAKTTVNLIRAMSPQPGAYTNHNDEKLKIWKARVIGEKSGFNGLEDKIKNARFGEILDIISKDGIVVKAGNGAVIITEIQSSGGRRMTTPEYLRGHSVVIGETFM